MTAPRSTAPETATTRPAWVLLVVGLGTLLNTLAGSSVNLALPVIGDEMGIGVALSRWVLLSFMLMVSVLLLAAGRASDLLGHRTTYLGGFALFGLSSLLCGASATFWPLMAGRLLQGTGAALTMAASPALLTTSFPVAQRGRALGLLATATYVGLTIGPPFGGAVISALGWRWIFFINVPGAVVTIALGLRFLPAGRRRRHVPFDVPGMLTLFAGMPLLLLALTQGQRWGWSAPTFATGAGGLLLFGLFVAVERRRAEPLLDLSLFRSPTFSGAAASAFCNYVAIFVPIILLPFYLLEAHQLGPSRAGVVLAVMPLLMALVASPAGSLSDRIGTRGLAVGGLLLQTVALVGLGQLGVLPPGSGGADLHAALWLGLLGLGTGLFITPNSSALMGAAPRGAQGTAGGVLALSRTTGMLGGVALGTAVFAAAGGRTGRHRWAADSLGGLRAALLMGAGASLVGALAAALRGRAKPAE